MECKSYTLFVEVYVCVRMLEIKLVLDISETGFSQQGKEGSPGRRRKNPDVPGRRGAAGARTR